MVPLYLRFLSAELYGAWLASGNILSWLTIVDPGISAVIQQRVAQAYGKGESDEVGKWIAGGVFVSLATALLLMSIGLVMSPAIPGLLGIDKSLSAELVPAFSMAVIGSGLMLIYFAIGSTNEGLQSSRAAGAIFITITTASIAMTAVLLFAGWGLLALGVGAITRGAGLLLLSSGYLWWRLASEKITFPWTLSAVRPLLALLSFTSLSRVATAALTHVDLFVAARLLGPEATSALALTRKGPEFCRLLVDRPALALMPALAHTVGSGNSSLAAMIVVRLMRLVGWSVGLLITGFLLLNRDFVRLWVGSAFFAGDTVNLLVCLTVGLAVFATALSRSLFALGNIKGNSVALFAQAIIYIPTILVMGRYFGLAGIASAGLLSALATTAWYLPWTFIRRVRLARGEVLLVTRDVAIAAVAGVAAYYCAKFTLPNPNTWPLFAGAALIVTIVFALVLLSLSPAARQEAGAIRAFLRKR
jgi:O-antigen/teichoic acid export membrane protein